MNPGRAETVAETLMQWVPAHANYDTVQEIRDLDYWGSEETGSSSAAAAAGGRPKGKGTFWGSSMGMPQLPSLGFKKKKKVEDLIVKRRCAIHIPWI